MRQSDVYQKIQSAFEDAEHQRKCVVASDRAMYEALRRYVRAGEVIRPLPGMHMRADLWNELSHRPRMRWRYAHDTYIALHPQCVLAAFSAALEYGLWVSKQKLGTMYLAVEKTTDIHASAKVHRIKCPACEIVKRRGVLMTDLVRTVLDCSLLGTFSEGLAIADSAVRYCGLDLDAYRGYVARNASNRPGAQRARQVARYADGRSENGGESCVRGRIIELGFMPPTMLQYEVVDPVDGGVLRIDMYYEFEDGRRLFVEVDGLEKYGEANGDGKDIKIQLIRERQRESHLTALGVPVMRILFARLYEPGYLESLLESYGVPRRKP